jgi:alpha-1,6-mannosyltransferase
MANISKQSWFIWLAIILSVIFCFETIVAYSNPSSTSFLSAYVRRGIEYSLLNGLYLIWLVEGIQQRKLDHSAIEDCKLTYQRFSDVIKVSLLFLITALISYPVTSDPYLYLHYGTMGLNGVNPYLIPAKDFASQFSSFFPWTQTSTYGPISTSFFIVAAAGRSVSVAVGVYILKTLFFIIHTINSYLIWNEMKGAEHRAFITLAYLINPIILFEQVGNCRVDVLLCTTLILLIGLLRQGNYIGSVIAAWAGILSKTLPIIWLPVLGVFLLRSQRWKSIAIAAFLSILLLLALSQTLFTEPRAWVSLLNPGVKWQSAGSFHDILNGLLSFTKPVLPTFFIEKQAGIVALFKTFTYGLYCLYYAWICFRVYFNRQYTAANLALQLGWLTLILFLLATPWYQPWYATILLCFAALLNFAAPFFCLAVLTYSVCSTVAYYIFAGTPAQALLFIASVITVIPTTVLLFFRSRFTNPNSSNRFSC